MRILDIAATGMLAQQTRVEVISNNLANMNTTAYNPRRAEFADLHYQQVQRAGTVAATDGTILPTGIQLGMGVRTTAVSPMLGQGAVQETGGSLDVAIEGQGYFEVALPDGRIGYTRDGALKLTGDGLIVTAGGLEVAPGIVIPEDAQSVAINADGEVYASFTNAVEQEFLGQLNLAMFVNPRGLEAMGSNLYLETAASGQPMVAVPGEDGLGTLRQGYLEQSTVDAVREVTDLIAAQRGYELNSKVISAADQMLAAMVQIR
ncbi:flagellar basal-body rod protein FlgG [Ketogulonicigenium vulgare]|uniref:Flagellar basal-body rod protein FlgG n=1 Tax=Ketogulonicigenium vulgare (strain WSH-001) TaxID=759362 RepID=F9Y4G1_KETVW|nr:flagellar basal-body rod protein FlgG [Ketogulonicigenium vulgare]ADO43495.1 flagellar basal-body rod protein FlgG [Ketogulonicigenium vulgare Y25]AEM41774.1 Flagellar basal-body rod protein FlgG [Ketogulonicigenium vulgare WSH-001]ALJ81880.1 flagellar basal-body rod protein FlgG [Ketogulonicigenium vulgare]ANW34529.1 flagellar basal-body rod protein FlgG [Ketogulonicigenium vulgare]AOZ55530.1 flagellar basal-body rod protein FlgG [Ketogulonicigenium vulgare]